MAIIRRVFGPFHPEQVGGAHPELRWYFNGIRDDKTTAHWVLVFEVLRRRWRASNVPINDSIVGRSRAALQAAGISSEVKQENSHPDAWLDGRPVMEGRITDILKSKLRPEDIARATSLGILKGENHGAPRKKTR